MDLSSLLQQNQNPASQGEEPTHSDPLVQAPALSEDDKKELKAIEKKYRQSWLPKRRRIIERVLKAFEFAKGNHFGAFDPDSWAYMDASRLALESGQQDEDLALYKFATNFYQMLMLAFVSVLSAQVPKSRALPENAERAEDMATAKVFSTVQSIVERQNDVRNLHKQALMLLWMAGSYFRHTRYLVDEDRAGTHQEPVYEEQQVQLAPDRHLCFGCGTMTPADSPESVTPNGASCPNCSAPLYDQNFFPAEYVPAPVMTGTREVPNGMVAQTLYSALEVDCDPTAKHLRETPLLALEVEMDIASARESFPDAWDKLSNGTYSSSDDSAAQDRMAREAARSEVTNRSGQTEDKITLTRTWIQPWAYNKTNKKEVAARLKQQFPKGCLVISVGENVLDVREATLTKEWSWCGTIQETFGLYPAGIGDPAIPIQERINDVENLTHEYMDRIALGMILVNESALDTKALSGKALLPGVLNGVSLKKGSQVRLADAIHHFQAVADENIYSYRDKLVFTMQLLAGVPPQVFGGAGDAHVETASGQSQQLNTAMGKLSLFWDNCREENAKAAELAVMCAARNMTDDWFSVVTDEASEWRNEYVRVNEMQGNVHAFPETDQGFPMTYGELKEWWQNLIEFSAQGGFAQMILSDPANMEQAAIYSGVPGLQVPGKNMRQKVLRLLDKLLQAEPMPTVASDGMTQVDVPSIQPDPDIDDMQVIVATVKERLQEKFELKETNPQGWANAIAYLKLAAQYDQEKQMQQAMAQAPPQGAPAPPRAQG